MEKASLVQVSKQQPTLNRQDPPGRDAAALRIATSHLNKFEMRFDRQFNAPLQRFYSFRQLKSAKRTPDVIDFMEFLDKTELETTQENPRNTRDNHRKPERNLKPELD